MTAQVRANTSLVAVEVAVLVAVDVAVDVPVAVAVPVAVDVDVTVAVDVEVDVDVDVPVDVAVKSDGEVSSYSQTAFSMFTVPALSVAVTPSNPPDRREIAAISRSLFSIPSESLPVPIQHAKQPLSALPINPSAHECTHTWHPPAALTALALEREEGSDLPKFLQRTQ
jgi:hypothetical protein